MPSLPPLPPVIEEAEEAGIPVVTVLSDNSDSSRISYVGISSYEAGELLGREAAKAIRESGTEDAGEIPIIALTADSGDDLKEKCLDSGMDNHLCKPVNTEELFRVLAREFDKR